jgi:micrococcal nuclease
MKRRFFEATTCLMLVFCFFTGIARAGQFRITKVYDGDTVRAEAPNLVIYIMLVGIDAPEISGWKNQPVQPFGAEAKEFLSRMILNKVVEVKGYGIAPSPHDNIIGVIYLEGKNVNLEMVTAGFAEACRENLPVDFDIQPYLKAEEEAKTQKKGMWGQGKNYVSPREWREKHRLGGHS